MFGTSRILIQCKVIINRQFYCTASCLNANKYQTGSVRMLKRLAQLLVIEIRKYLVFSATFLSALAYKADGRSETCFANLEHRQT